MNHLQECCLPYIFVILSCGWVSNGEKTGVKKMQDAGNASPSPITTQSHFPAAGREVNKITSKAPSKPQCSDSIFRNLIESGGTYIDKTEFIPEAIRGRRVNCISVSRPRGFGKSLNLDMLREFLRVDRDSRTIFKTGMAIMGEQHKNFRAEYMNKCPVIFLPLKSIGKCKTFEEAKREFHQVIRHAFNEFIYLTESDAVTSKQKTIFKELIDRKEYDDEDFKALRELTTMLHRHHGRKIFLIVDDLDSPITGATLYGYTDQMISLMSKTFFEKILFRYPPDIDKAIFAGVVPVLKLFRSRMWIFFYTIYDTDFLVTSFGFTDKDVKGLLKKSGKGNDVTLMTSISDWYNQFNIGTERIYNPYSILKCYEANWDVKPYATASRSLSALTKYLFTDKGLFPALNFQILMTNATLEKTVWTYAPSIERLLSQESYLWSYFGLVGLLFLEDYPFGKNENEYRNRNQFRIRLRGKDIQCMLQKEVIEPLVRSEKLPDHSRFTQLVQTEDTHEVTKIMEKYIKNAGSYFHSSVCDVANLVRMIMTNWMNDFGGSVKIEIPDWGQRMLKFYDKEKKEKMRVHIQPRPTVWEQIRNFLSTEVVVTTDVAGPPGPPMHIIMKV